jgi:hypothetical protein
MNMAKTSRANRVRFDVPYNPEDYTTLNKLFTIGDKRSGYWDAHLVLKMYTSDFDIQPYPFLTPPTLPTMNPLSGIVLNVYVKHTTQTDAVVVSIHSIHKNKIPGNTWKRVEHGDSSNFVQPVCKLFRHNFSEGDAKANGWTAADIVLRFLKLFGESPTPVYYDYTRGEVQDVLLPILLKYGSPTLEKIPDISGGTYKFYSFNDLPRPHIPFTEQLSSTELRFEAHKKGDFDVIDDVVEKMIYHYTNKQFRRIYEETNFGYGTEYPYTVSFVINKTAIRITTQMNIVKDGVSRTVFETRTTKEKEAQTDTLSLIHSIAIASFGKNKPLSLSSDSPQICMFIKARIDQLVGSDHLRAFNNVDEN